MFATAIYFDGKNVYQTNVLGGDETTAIESFKADMSKQGAKWGRLFVTASGKELYHHAIEHDGQSQSIEELPEHIQKAIAYDSEEMRKALAEYPNLAPEECCPHSSANSEYIGDGDTQHTCRCCAYYWITSNPNYE